jgi:hypothetical protein
MKMTEAHARAVDDAKLMQELHGYQHRNDDDEIGRAIGDRQLENAGLLAEVAAHLRKELKP